MADSSNTARNILLIGALLGVGAAAAGVYISSSEKVEPIHARVDSSGKTPALTQQAVQLKENAFAPRQVADVAPQGAVVPRLAAKDGAEPRYTPLFFAPKLWRVSEGAAAGVRDLLSPKAPNLHGSVPNTEFFKYGLENLLGQADALEQDSDGDGFSNGEEFAAGTNPNDRASMPAFASNDGVKMLFSRFAEEKHSLVLGSSYPFTGEIDISIHDWVGNAMKPARTSQRKGLKVGDTFGFGENAAPGPDSSGRFKVVAEGAEGDKKYIEIEDTYTKLGSAKSFKIFPGTKEGARGDVSDVTVHLRMTAGPQKSEEPIKDADGKAARKFQLGETFDVPGFPNVKCTIETASKNSVSIKIDGKEPAIIVKKAPNSAKKS